MPDLLVPLFKLPLRELGVSALESEGVVIRHPMSYELTVVSRFVAERFSQSWADENAASFARRPITSYIAVENDKVVGFAAYEATCRSYFGPTGVLESHRGRGIGKALLIASLWGLRDMGYAYAIIGAAGPVDFYAKTVNAIVIEGVGRGIYPPTLQG